MLSRTLTQAGHTRCFIVRARPASGWEVLVEHDNRVVRAAHYTDWHRLERAVDAIAREVDQLQARGWHSIATSGAGVSGQSTNL